MEKIKQGEPIAGRYTKTTMILHFLEGSIHFFVISILGAFCVTLLEMLVPQLIRFTVDSVIGNEAPSLPGFLNGPLEAMGGVVFLRGNLQVIAGPVSYTHLSLFPSSFLMTRRVIRSMSEVEREKFKYLQP